MSAVRVVLASGSPRRAELLTTLRIPFEIEVPQIDETPRPGEPAADYVVRLAREKALAAARPGALTLAADTAVVLDGRILGKPADRADGVAMLRALAGRDHEVMTGLAASDGARTLARCVATRVWFRDIDEAEAEAYWNTGEPADKAGGYGIQGIGGIFARTIQGSYSAVVGLPLLETEQLLREFGIDTWRGRGYG